MIYGGSSQRKTKIIHECSTTQIGSQVMYERIGKTYMDYLDVDKEIAERYLDRALNNLEISQLQYNLSLIHISEPTRPY